MLRRRLFSGGQNRSAEIGMDRGWRISGDKQTEDSIGLDFDFISFLTCNTQHVPLAVANDRRARSHTISTTLFSFSFFLFFHPYITRASYAPLDGSHLRANSRQLRFIYNASHLREPHIFKTRRISPGSGLRTRLRKTVRSEIQLTWSMINLSSDISTLRMIDCLLFKVFIICKEKD